jgi:glucose-1-phosphate thymidylyltransferase
MRGIILAGGSGTRLHPLTIATSKQLLPVYDKPMIYYPLSTLMLAGIREVLVITTPHEAPQFQRLLGDGSQWAISISYEVQASPGGLAEAFLIGESFIAGEPVCLILGDNIFFGPGLGRSLDRMHRSVGASIFAYRVEKPQRYGVIELDENGEVVSLEEKPAAPKSSLVVPGLYFYDGSVSELAKQIQPSTRGELEITDLNRAYLARGLLSAEVLGQEITWLDAGTIDALHDASTMVFDIERRAGRKINVPEEVAWRKGLIVDEQLRLLAAQQSKSGYGEYLLGLLES